MQINLNVWTDLVLHLLASARGAPAAHQDAKTHRAAWAVASTGGLAFCFLAAYTFPVRCPQLFNQSWPAPAGLDFLVP
jgi:hypothetical protein